MERLYPSKRDLWITALLWMAVAGMLFAAWAFLQSPGAAALRAGMAALFGAASALVLWILYGTSYTVTDSEITIRSGPFRWRVALDAIEEIHPTRNPLSSPACSLDRLHIRHTGARAGVLVSPLEKTDFLRDVVTRAPHLILVGDRVEARGDV